MIKETIYTSIGAAALAVEFAVSPTKQQGWLKKAERRGSRLANSGQRRLRPVTRRVESAIGDVRSSTLSAVGLSQNNVAAAETRVERTTREVKRRTPRVRVTRRTRGARGRKIQSSTLTLQTPVSQAS